MGEISKIRVDGEVYEVKDAEAREGVQEVAEQAAGAVANEAEARAEAVEAEAEAREADVAKCFRDGGVVEMTEGKAVMVGRDAGIKGTLTFDNELKLNVKHGGKNFEAFRVGDEHVRISTTHDDEDNAYFNMDSGAKIEFGCNNGIKVELSKREGVHIQGNSDDDFVKIGNVDGTWNGVHIQGNGIDTFIKAGNVDGTWDGVHIQGDGSDDFVKIGDVDGKWEGVHIQGYSGDDFVKIGSVDGKWEGVSIQGHSEDNFITVGNVDRDWFGVYIQGNGDGTFIKVGSVDNEWEGVHIQGNGDEENGIKIGYDDAVTIYGYECVMLTTMNGNDSDNHLEMRPNVLLVTFEGNARLEYRSDGDLVGFYHFGGSSDRGTRYSRVVTLMLTATDEGEQTMRLTGVSLFGGVTRLTPTELMRIAEFGLLKLVFNDYAFNVIGHTFTGSEGTTGLLEMVVDTRPYDLEVNGITLNGLVRFVYDGTDILSFIPIY